MKDPACRVAPERGGPSRKRRPSPSSGTATNTPAHPRRPKISRRSSREVRRAAAEQETAPLHGATPAGRPARGPVGQRASGQERGKRACGSAQKRRTLRSAQRGTECDLGKSRSISGGPSGPPLHLAPVIVTVRPRLRRRLGGASPCSGTRGIERGAGLPAGVQSGLK